MSRRRLSWLCATALLVGGALAAWYVLAARDSDFHVIGPKTRGIRANLALLEKSIDAGEFRHCETLEKALDELNAKVFEDPEGPGLRFIWIEQGVLVDDAAFAEAKLPKGVVHPIQLPEDTQSMTVKQLLRTLFQQAGVPDVQFIVRAHTIEATTLREAQEARKRYLDRVTLYDRLRTFWKDLTGEVEEDPALLRL